MRTNDIRSFPSTRILTDARFPFQIRSVFRTIELSQGYRGSLATCEACLYGLDTLPLFIAIVVFIPFWPGRFITAEPGTEEKVQLEEVAA